MDTCSIVNQKSHLVEEAKLEDKVIVEHWAKMVARTNLAERHFAHAYIALHCVLSLKQQVKLTLSQNSCYGIF